ncbi:MAG: flagellar hook-associated protein FlgL [Symbiobacteriaceae bacterium]
MRITGGMMITGLLRDLRRAQEALSTFQNQLASGKRVQRPSDDPVATVDSMRLRARIAEVERMQKNAEHARDWLETTDAALDQATQILQRARELAVRAASGSLPDSSLEALRAEVEQLRAHLVEVAKTTLGGDYIFSGFLTDTAPYSIDGNGNVSPYQGDSGRIEREVAPGVRMTINVLGDEVFDDAFTALHNLINDLQNGDTAAISQSRIGELDKAIDQVLRLRAEVGAKVNRIELGLNRMMEIRIDTERLLSEVEDVDVAETVMRLSVSEAAYRAALMAGARIVQPTLMDFLR